MKTPRSQQAPGRFSFSPADSGLLLQRRPERFRIISR
ncbi:hypothetical protein MXAN_0963 [Myxococcus xanthus DK 1622]|uniref:Uncharacterized protein n=1 Tax=Myxococcus xanthus (strain DK1622) TaxID=246197 RepID=Q1DDP9_MYXXD|nr:hypothetical protein MXAN_0963 [Myxococcus xanthus DK 1622]